MKFTIQKQNNICFGLGEFDHILTHVQSFGSSLLLVVGSRSHKQTPWFTSLIDQCDHAKIDYNIVQITHEPTSNLINTIVQNYSKKSIQVVVAIGGGSVIDSGKMIAASLPCSPNSEQESRSKVPFIVVPTTAGTGSEVTSRVALTQSENQLKEFVFDTDYLPDLVISDAQLMTTCPDIVTCSTAMGLLTQLIESMISTQATPYGKMMAREGILQFVPFFSRLVSSNNNNLKSQSAMAYASILSGFSAADSGQGLISGLAMVIGSRWTIPHGLLCLSLLVPILKATVQQCRDESMTEVLQSFDALGQCWAHPSMHDLDGSTVLIDQIEAWVDDMVYPRWSDYGFKMADIEWVVSQNIHHQYPVKLPQATIETILEGLIQ